MRGSPTRGWKGREKPAAPADLRGQSPRLRPPRGDAGQQLRARAGPVPGHTLTGDLGGVHVCLIRILRLGLLASEPSLLTARQGVG